MYSELLDETEMNCKSILVKDILRLNSYKSSTFLYHYINMFVYIVY